MSIRYIHQNSLQNLSIIIICNQQLENMLSQFFATNFPFQITKQKKHEGEKFISWILEVIIQKRSNYILFLKQPFHDLINQIFGMFSAQLSVEQAVCSFGQYCIEDNIILKQLQKMSQKKIDKFIERQDLKGIFQQVQQILELLSFKFQTYSKEPIIHSNQKKKKDLINIKKQKQIKKNRKQQKLIQKQPSLTDVQVQNSKNIQNLAYIQYLINEQQKYQIQHFLGQKSTAPESSQGQNQTSIDSKALNTLLTYCFEQFNLKNKQKILSFCKKTKLPLLKWSINKVFPEYEIVCEAKLQIQQNSKFSLQSSYYYQILTCKGLRQGIQNSSFKLLLKIICSQSYYGYIFRNFVQSDKTISKNSIHINKQEKNKLKKKVYE